MEEGMAEMMFYVRAPREDIAFITKNVEAAGHLAVVTTTDRQNGILRILCDTARYDEVLGFLAALGCAPCSFMEFGGG